MTHKGFILFRETLWLCLTKAQKHACFAAERRIAELYDDLRRADFQGDKEAVAGASVKQSARSHGSKRAGPLFFKVPGDTKVL